MKFSLFFEMQIAEPSRRTERELFHQCVEQAVLADRLGYHAVWAVEHHGLREYAHCSAPEVFLSYVAARTERVRIGHGVTLTPYRYNHPMRIAERVAMLDVLSDGRVNWGSGKSGSRTEQEAFESDIPALRDQWLEAQAMIPQMWTRDVFEWQGKFLNIPPTQVVPKPVQQPHPPMFAACTTPASTLEAGGLGLGVLNFAAGTKAELTKKVDDYRAAVAGAEPIGEVVTNHYACTPISIVLDDDRKACEFGFRGGRYFWRSQQEYYAYTNRPIGPLDADAGPLSDEELRTAMDGRHADDAPLTGVIGSPAACREQVQRFQDAGVDELILIMQLGTVPHEVTMTSIRTFAEKVMPWFA
ncbi:LLM class flavin-dependent oxidoreductase [Micromonospora sp. NBC_01412]|uniref:LLM class flavin-dependent oxidoreductase n=1 Tax=Micromonospora sp. NBC_01412 TaxID=2903590 RepID=UPI003250E745